MNSDKKLLKIKQSKADRRIAEKICKYLRRDEFRKLEKSFFAVDDKIHPDSVLNKRGMTGLMISSKLGHPDCLNVFLRKGASRKLTCFKGNIALHYAAKYCMKHPYPSNVRNLVTIPFLDSTTDYHELMKMPNANGTTPKLLLDALNKVMYDDTVEGSDSSDSSLDNAQKTAQNSSDWSQKLQHEDQDEHYDRFGKFDVWEDTGYKNKFNETENEWADRIYAEFSRLQSRNNKKNNKKNTMEDKKEKDSKKSPKKKELLLKIPKKNPEAKQTLFRDKLSKLLDPQNTQLITTNSLLPFDENSTSDYIINQLLDGSESTTATGSQATGSQATGSQATGSQVQDRKRKRIKEVIRIWHPDKFSQLYHQRIDPEHRDDIIRIVTHISQALLNFGRQ